MYRLDKTQNSIQPIQRVLFSDLNLRERSHLQEWIAKHPQALTQDTDDELLIIQKEFSGFDDTNERLDLLALDKMGNLVIIENKLDDSGKDVVWQALKYAGYCSGMNKEQILEVFQRYLNSQQGDEKRDAAEIIVEFLECGSLDEVTLNQVQSQRIILVAANFRKEVTNTALWLMAFGLRVQCFRVTPYQLENEVLLDVHQVIPPPEAEEYMIRIAKKEKEEQAQAGEVIKRYGIRKKFWTELLIKLREKTCNLYNNVNPSTDLWLSAGSGISGLHYNMIFGTRFIRVEFYLSKSNGALNSFAFNWLQSKREQIEQMFGQPLEWQPLEGKKACRIKFSKDLLQGYDEENWPDLQAWLMAHITALEKAISPHIEELGRAIRSQAQAFGTAEEEQEQAYT